MSLAQLVFSNQDDGAETEFTHSGGKGWLSVDATFGGATVKLQFKGANDVWFTIGTALTAPGIISFDGPSGLYRIEVSAAVITDGYATLHSFRS